MDCHEPLRLPDYSHIAWYYESHPASAFDEQHHSSEVCRSRSFWAHRHDSPLSEQIFYIAMAQVEAIVQPNGVTDDIGGESVTLICIHGPILPIPGS